MDLITSNDRTEQNTAAKDPLYLPVAQAFADPLPLSLRRQRHRKVPLRGLYINKGLQTAFGVMFRNDCKGPISLTQGRGYKIEAVF